MGQFSTPLDDYLRETRPGRSWMRGFYGRFIGLLAPMPMGAARTAPPPEGDVENFWERHHATASAFSTIHGDRYRSSYVMACSPAWG